jgi:hypothetical protein
VLEGFNHGVENVRADKRLVARDEKSCFGVRLDVWQRTLDGAALTRSESAIVDELDSETGHDSGERRAAMANDEQNLAQSRGKNPSGDSAHQGFAVKIDELLGNVALESCRGTSSQDDSAYLTRSTHHHNFLSRERPLCYLPAWAVWCPPGWVLPGH